MTYRGPFRVRVENKPEPEIHHPEDAIVRVTRAAICGSDIHLYHGLMPDTRVGQTFGHEFIGVVERVGPKVEKLKEGDKVLVPFNVCCGFCYFCSRGLYGNCHNTNPAATAVGGIYGYSHTCGGYDGGQAEYVRVPYANFGPEIIPEGISDDDALLLTDACPTGYQAAQMADIDEGDTVIIFGAGPVGIFAARSAWLMGAGRVIVTDHLDYRLDFVSRYGPAEVINFTHLKDPVVYFKKITDYIGADACIDAVGCDASGSILQSFSGFALKAQAGNAVALHWAINSVRKGGTISIIGAYGPPMNLVPLGSIMNKGLTVRSNQASVKRNLPRLYEHVRNGLIKPSEIITHRFPLDDIAEAYRTFTSKLDGCIKPVVVHLSIEHPNLTPVFGTSCPAKGLSGVLRDYAFRYSEATNRHWMTLVLADRVDILESTIASLFRGEPDRFIHEKGWKANLEYGTSERAKYYVAGAVIGALALGLWAARRK